MRPVLIASMRLSTSVYAVRMMRTASGACSWLRRSSSTPVMPGIRYSVTMTATSAARKMSSAASPPAARTTRNSAARIAWGASRPRSSSSTIRTVAGSMGPRAPSHRTGDRRDGRLLAEDLVEHGALLEALEARGAQFAVAHRVAHLTERLLARDDMRSEETCHALDAGGGEDRPADHDELAAPV